MVEIKLENIVASTEFAEKLDLDMIAHSLEGSEYEPEQFPGLVYHLEKPKTAVLLFRSGKANITGAKNVDQAHQTAKIVAQKLKEIGVEVYDDPKVVVQNMVGISDLKIEPNLNEVAIGLGLENVEYEPEQFPGLVYRIDEPRISILLFGSGKVVCAGAKKVEDVEKAVEKLSEKLRNLGIL
ncbi:MAG: TATA-box-binding protein [Candidatus Thermoplasmatota archaeon]